VTSGAKMENSPAENPEIKARRRRRSHPKRSKEAIERGRRLKAIGLWILIIVVGASLVAAIAILAGYSAS
jgi:hypothetical protein